MNPWEEALNSITEHQLHVAKCQLGLPRCVLCSRLRGEAQQKLTDALTLTKIRPKVVCIIGPVVEGVIMNLSSMGHIVMHRDPCTLMAIGKGLTTDKRAQALALMRVELSDWVYVTEEPHYIKSGDDIAQQIIFAEGEGKKIEWLAGPDAVPITSSLRPFCKVHQDRRMKLEMNDHPEHNIIARWICEKCTEDFIRKEAGKIKITDIEKRPDNG